MKRIAIAAAALALMGAAAIAPASAHVYFGADPDGTDVQVGPVGVRVGPDWGYHHHHHHWRDYAYDRDCRVVRSRTVTGHGDVIWRTRRICD